MKPLQALLWQVEEEEEEAGLVMMPRPLRMQRLQPAGGSPTRDVPAAAEDRYGREILALGRQHARLRLGPRLCCARAGAGALRTGSLGVRTRR